MMKKPPPRSGSPGKARAQEERGEAAALQAPALKGDSAGDKSQKGKMSSKKYQRYQDFLARGKMQGGPKKGHGVAPPGEAKKMPWVREVFPPWGRILPRRSER